MKFQMPEMTHFKNFVNGSLRFIHTQVVQAVNSGSNLSKTIEPTIIKVPHDDGDQRGNGGFGAMVG